MACGNNMVSRSGLQSPPAPIAMLAGPGPARHQLPPQQVAVVQQQARAAMDSAERKVATAATPATASEAVKEAQRALDAARRTRGPAHQRAALVRELERKLDSVKRAASAAGDAPVQAESAAVRSLQDEEFTARLQSADRLGRMQLGVPARPPAYATTSPDRGPGSEPGFAGTGSSSPWPDSIDYGQLPGATGVIDDAQYGPALEEAWTRSYRTATAGEREVVSFTVGTFTWVWDVTAEEGQTENRLIGVYGRSDPQGLPRDKNRISGFPSPQRHHAVPVHRGHPAGHELGGPDEGWNLIPQLGSVNQGGQWRELERYCADHPGTFMFVHAIYSNDTDESRRLEYGVMRQGGLVVEQFDNL